MPFTSRKLWDILNLSEKVRLRWEEALNPVPPGHKIKEAKPLFHKVEASEDEMWEMLERLRTSQETVSFEEFSKMDLRVGKIVKAKPVPKSKKLLRLLIDIGDNLVKQAVAGIAQYYTPKELEGRQVAVIVNLEPRKIFGLDSEVMILAAEDKKANQVVLIQPEKRLETGSKIR